MKRDYRLFLKDIIEAIESIEEFIEGINFKEFINDDKTASAVIRKFEVIGEATKNIPNSIRQKNTNIPWSQMAGMRDRLIH
ncbi:MAG: HepT-like ribonuclease domain-containing protein, partial [Candidatus Heimdallarchaeaceae archaeon]